MTMESVPCFDRRTYDMCVWVWVDWRSPGKANMFMVFRPFSYRNCHFDIRHTHRGPLKVAQVQSGWFLISMINATKMTATMTSFCGLNMVPHVWAMAILHMNAWWSLCLALYKNVCSTFRRWCSAASSRWKAWPPRQRRSLAFGSRKRLCEQVLICHVIV